MVIRLFCYRSLWTTISGVSRSEPIGACGFRSLSVRCVLMTTVLMLVCNFVRQLLSRMVLVASLLLGLFA